MPYYANNFKAVNHDIVCNNNADYTDLKLKPNHHLLPVYVDRERFIYFETFHKHKEETQEFLNDIAEPLSRTQHIHIYQLTDISLYSAVSGGKEAKTIKKILEKICKSEIPSEIYDFINDATSNYGKVNLILQNGKMKIASTHYEKLVSLTRDEAIKRCLVKDADGNVFFQPISNSSEQDQNSQKFSNTLQNVTQESHIVDISDFESIQKEIDKQSETDPNRIKELPVGMKCFEFAVEIQKGKLEDVKKRARELGSTLLSEYDFLRDSKNRNVQMAMKNGHLIRPYQVKSLEKMFCNNRARSGIIVLPCGAGKTLLGVAAASRIQKRCLVFTTGSVVVDQWKNTFVKWTTIEEKRISKFTSTSKVVPNASLCDIFITTYSIISFQGKRSSDTEKILEFLSSVEWGLIILDEVHSIPADTFRSCLEKIHGHCFLGLTATLLREDDKIDDLNYLVGPKLYEANWMELQDNGFIARVQCVEVLVTLDPIFLQEYLNASVSEQMFLSVMNPGKFRMCQFLINYHENRGDKILVFSDNIDALNYYARKLERAHLKGDTSHDERMAVMENFKRNDKIQTLFVSKMADIAFDLPNANVLIQISSQGGSRRQETQRLGRITRAKEDMSPDEINAFFYTIITADTKEVEFGKKRQRYLKDQGYEYKAIKTIEGMDSEDLMYKTKEERLIMLNESRDLMTKANKKEKPSKEKKPKIKNSKEDQIQASIRAKRKEYFDSNDVINHKRRKY